MRSSPRVYRCSKCGYEFPKEGVPISGYDTATGSRHIHCPKCGKKINI